MLDSLAVTLARGGDLSAALEQINSVLKQAPSDKRLFFKGNILMRMQRIEEARSIFTSLAAKGGKLASKAQWVLAVLAWNEGDWDLARAELKKLSDNGGDLKARADKLLGVLQEIENGSRDADAARLPSVIRGSEKAGT